jgi:hypothetical protein
MVVMWCRSCGALLGLRRPFYKWTEDRDGLCPLCSTQPKLADGAVPDGPAAEAGKGVADETDEGHAGT